MRHTNLSHDGTDSQLNPRFTLLNFFVAGQNLGLVLMFTSYASRATISRFLCAGSCANDEGNGKLPAMPTCNSPTLLTAPQLPPQLNEVDHQNQFLCLWIGVRKSRPWRYAPERLSLSSPSRIEPAVRVSPSFQVFSRG